ATASSRTRSRLATRSRSRGSARSKPVSARLGPGGTRARAPRSGSGRRPAPPSVRARASRTRSSKAPGPICCPVAQSLWPGGAERGRGGNAPPAPALAFIAHPGSPGAARLTGRAAPEPLRPACRRRARRPPVVVHPQAPSLQRDPVQRLDHPLGDVTLDLDDRERVPDLDAPDLRAGHLRLAG